MMITIGQHSAHNRATTADQRATRESTCAACSFDRSRLARPSDDSFTRTPGWLDYPTHLDDTPQVAISVVSGIGDCPVVFWPYQA